jgi:hypothetical protein
MQEMIEAAYQQFTGPRLPWLSMVSTPQLSAA